MEDKDQNEADAIAAEEHQQKIDLAQQIINKVDPPKVIIAIFSGEYDKPEDVKNEDKLVEIMSDGGVRMYNHALTPEGASDAAKMFWQQLEAHGKTMMSIVRDRAMAITAQSIYLKTFIKGAEEILADPNAHLTDCARANLEGVAKVAKPWSERAYINQVTALSLVRMPKIIPPEVPGLYVLFFAKDPPEITRFGPEQMSEYQYLSKTDYFTHWALIEAEEPH